MPPAELDTHIEPAHDDEARDRRSSGWDIRNAAGNYSALIAFQLGSALASFAAIWLITRLLGSEGYGGVVAVIAASQVAQVAVNWTATATVRFGVDEFVETERIAATFWLRFVVMVVNVAIVAVISPLWFPPLAGWLKLSPETLSLVLIHFALTALWIHVQMSLQAAKLMRLQGGLQMAERVIILAGLLLLIAAADLNPTTAIYCYIAAPAIIFAVGLLRLRPYIWSRFRIDGSMIRRFFAYSVPLLPFTLIGYFSGNYVDAVFVSGFLSTSDLGIYSIASQINGIALQIPVLANTLLLPLFLTLKLETDSRRIHAYFHNVLPTATLAWGMLCTLMAFAGQYAIPLVFGGEFASSTLPLWILLTAAAMSAPALLGFSAYAHAISATYISTVSVVFSAVTNIVLNFLLIPRYGLAGCAFATLITYLVSTAVTVAMTRQIGGVAVSWTVIAILPALIGVAVLAWVGNALLALVAVIIATVIVAIVYRRSIRDAISVRELIRTS